ncbi:MAG: FAD-binding oxidoreductase [Methanomassiliicoccales archaeon]|nr:FAD-binding oxidoreductase [Methanomassiliicoccales archaeon]
MKQELLVQIKEIVGEGDFSTKIADLYVYGFDASIHHRNPEVIVRPKSTDQVSRILRLANKNKVPVLARGGGTGLCGSAVPLEGGIVMDMTRMNEIKEIRVGDLYCIVGPGVIYDKLNEALAPYKFFFPPTPGSGEACTIGGMVATNASGMRAIKYGATRDYVLGLEVVLANGEVMRVGTKTIKNSSGYQLERLFVGSEGTLGVITEVTLKVAPKPKKAAMVVAAFDSLEKAGKCVSAIIAKPMIPSAIELMDKICIKAVNKTMHIGFPDFEALCLIEVDGEPRVVEDEVREINQICKDVGAVSVEFSADTKQMNKWTAGRKAVLPALSRYGDEFVSVSLADDMSVPISRIPETVVAFQKIAERNHVIIGTYGHAADGNLHTKMLLDPLSPDSWKNGEIAVGEIFDTVIEVGGTVTGEHGVGISKAPYMQKERAEALKAMELIKKALDPNDILNPGKIMEWKGSIIQYLRYPCEIK